ncbi:hypothetical protein ACFL35_02395 [Candidatus Riflebacteria bacterium]
MKQLFKIMFLLFVLTSFAGVALLFSPKLLLGVMSGGLVFLGMLVTAGIITVALAYVLYTKVYSSLSKSVQESNQIYKIKRNSEIGGLFKQYEKEKEILDGALENFKIDRTTESLINKVRQLQDRCLENCKQYLFIEKSYGPQRAQTELASLKQKIGQSSQMMKEINDKIMKISLLSSSSEKIQDQSELEEMNIFLDTQLDFLGGSYEAVPELSEPDKREKNKDESMQTGL